MKSLILNFLLVVTVWALKKFVVHFGVLNFMANHCKSWWQLVENFVKERQEALAPRPIRGLGSVMLKLDSKVFLLSSLSNLKVCFILCSPYSETL